MTAPRDDESIRTGNQRVDAAIERLRELEGEPVEAHSAVYEAVHEELRASLTEAGADHGENGSGAHDQAP